MAFRPDFGTVLRDAQRGDDGALASIYREFAPLVLGYLRANRAADPEDVTGDVFLSMLKDLARFEGDETHFRGWLLTIAHRRMIDDLRRRARRAEDPAPPEVLLALGGDVPGADAAAFERLAAATILTMIDELTPDQRHVLLLRVLADLPVRQIALTVDKPETAVRSLLHRASVRMHRAWRAANAVERDVDPAPAGPPDRTNATAPGDGVVAGSPMSARP